MEAVYLYGDATPSGLTGDFIAFLREAIDFSARALTCDGRITEAAERAAQLDAATEEDIRRAEVLAIDVTHVLERAGTDDGESLASRCAQRTRSSMTELLRTEAGAARAAVAAEQGRAAQVAAREREAFVQAFEALLLRHSPPDSVEAIEVVLESDGRYAAKLHGCAAFGAEWTLALEVPSTHVLARGLRIDRLVDRLEVAAPEEAGWIHKEVKVRPQRFDRLHLTELTVDPAEVRAALRASPDGSAAGYDLTFSRETGRAQLTRVGSADKQHNAQSGDAETDAPYEVTGDDLQKLQSLRDRLIATATELATQKKSLLAATLDGTPLDQVAAPRAFVDRLVAGIAPEVKRIAERSPTASELAIKRQVTDNHREELYVSKAELEAKIATLPDSLRSALDPLGLWAPAPAAEPFALLREPGPARPMTVPSPGTTSSPPLDGLAARDSTRELVALNVPSP